MTTEGEKRTTNDQRRVEILQYVLDRQKAKQRTTKAEVIRHMRGDSAVNTTHGLIQDLIKEGKINVEKLNSQVHFLTINEKFSLPQFERELLIQTITEIHSYYENIVRENESLVSFLKQVINDDRLRKTIKYSFLDIPGAGFGDVEIKIVFKEKPQKKSSVKHRMKGR